MTSDEDWVPFGLVELDLLAAHAGVPMPYPLRVPSFGRIAGERDVLLAAAALTLRARGLADDHGPVATAAELVTALREHRGTVDLVVFGPDGPVGAVAVVYRSWALVCRQRLTDELTETVEIRRVAQTALAEELIGMVPDRPPAVSMPIVLPPGVVRSALRIVGDGADASTTEQRLRDLVSDRGGDPGVLERLTGLVAALTGRGQLGATRRTGSSPAARAGTELSWLDGPRGRVRVGRTDDGWLNVNPLRHTDLRFAVNELALIARKENHEHTGSSAVARSL
ncbi:cytochrome C biogenesis protein [Actinosynnema sp. ALI-1.44]|uniref:ESX secretion-associated protein EspG n=1 Tax=Actinosynnema sp. ALI-1.44 TaxID=1933779 RepID=UPI00097C90CA|nr:ESX secretion-associated protein EspG [Actinosynnema sp. ALI-1.44]ONI75137.1 cytochrome C biogenesis protein [Actinosynnema sp. ALI-1.44]